MSDESAIRETITNWLRASKEGDSKALSSLLDDDVLFVVPGRTPFGKSEFFAGSHAAPARFGSRLDVLEVVVHGDWALTRVELQLEIQATEDAATVKLAGPTMTVWRRSPAGRWRIWRDANMVVPVGG